MNTDPSDSLFKDEIVGSFYLKFRNPDFNLQFKKQLATRMNLTWDRILKVCLPLYIVLIITQTILKPNISGYILVAEAVLFFTFFLGWFLSNKIKNHNLVPLISLISGLLIQFSIIAILAFAEFPGKSSPIAYMAIVIGATAPNTFMNRFIMGLVPAVGYISVVVFNDVFDLRFTIYHSFLVCLAFAYSIGEAWQQELSQMKEILLKNYLQIEKAKSEDLLHNVLPESIADKIKNRNERGLHFVQSFESVSVLFADLVGFTKYAAETPADKTIEVLSQIFRRFDAIIEQHGIQKIKTIGDAYMAASGLPEPDNKHAEKMAHVACDMREAIKKFNHLTGFELQLRIGIHCGPVIAGVLGSKRFLYDLWGNTVNIASRMESHGIPGEIQISEAMTEKLKSKFHIENRGRIDVKGCGSLPLFLLKRPIV